MCLKDRKGGCGSSRIWDRAREDAHISNSYFLEKPPTGREGICKGIFWGCCLVYVSCISAAQEYGLVPSFMIICKELVAFRQLFSELFTANDPQICCASAVPGNL